MWLHLVRPSLQLSIAVYFTQGGGGGGRSCVGNPNFEGSFSLYQIRLFATKYFLKHSCSRYTQFAHFCTACSFFNFFVSCDSRCIYSVNFRDAFKKYLKFHETTLVVIEKFLGRRFSFCFVSTSEYISLYLFSGCRFEVGWNIIPLPP